MDTSPRIAKIVINLSLDREFDYLIPDSLRGMVQVGSRVWVPFGHTERVGYVVGLAPSSAVSLSSLKAVLRLGGRDDEIPGKLVELGQWIADYYCCAREQAMRALLPAVVRKGNVRHKEQAWIALNPEKNLAEVLALLEKRAKKQAVIVRELVRLGGRSEARALLRAAQAGPGALENLIEKQVVTTDQQQVDRDPFAGDVILPTQALVLTADQQRALATVVGFIEKREARVVLLQGVTGSGKTEVYLQAISRCLELGRDAIVLVPEISLTPQTVERFRARFGETVSVLHSGLSDGERFDEWKKVSTGRTRIVVGARSALFAPVRNPGVIIVDEEHENTYKQEEAPRYNARDVAVMRAQFEKATVILGSATPSLESAYNAQVGKYTLVELPQRVDNQVMPMMELVDMRTEAMMRGQAQTFSRRLEELIRDRLTKGEQTILFLNRRGYASQMLCMACGYVATCADCNAAFTYHRAQGQLICHLCGHVLKAPEQCPACKDPKLRYSGLGTEKVESICRKLFPFAELGRMDSDTMTAKNAHRKMLMDFRSGRVQILIGTQMIAKGLHFPNVTLVGVIFADMGLHIPDFRSGERTFQLLVQVAGRAGRGDVPGHVIVQTYTPFHPVLQYALGHDYKAFRDDELKSRAAVGFPPVSHCVMIHFRGESEMRVNESAEDFCTRLRPLLDPATSVAGPMAAPIPRIRNQFRYQLLLRGGSILRLTKLLRPLVLEWQHRAKDIDAFADVDPYSLL